MLCGVEFHLILAEDDDEITGLELPGRQQVSPVQNIEGIKKDRNFAVYKIDIIEKNALKSIFEKEAPEKVIHLAAMAGVRYSSQEPQMYAKVNGIGTLNILELCKDFKIRSVVFSSSSSVYGNNALPSKELIEGGAAHKLNVADNTVGRGKDHVEIGRRLPFRVPEKRRKGKPAQNSQSCECQACMDAYPNAHP